MLLNEKSDWNALCRAADPWKNPVCFKKFQIARLVPSSVSDLVMYIYLLIVQVLYLYFSIQNETGYELAALIQEHIGPEKGLLCIYWDQDFFRGSYSSVYTLLARIRAITNEELINLIYESCSRKSAPCLRSLLGNWAFSFLLFDKFCGQL